MGRAVSSQGGVAAAPARGRALRATAIQLFTKTPNQWREPAIATADVARFRTEVTRHGLECVVAHDSYVINLASPDPVLRTRSIESFRNELLRCRELGIRAVVSHPGNYMDDREAGVERNARAYAECLAAVPGDVEVWIEGTAGSARRWVPGSRSCGSSGTPGPTGPLPGGLLPDNRHLHAWGTIWRGSKGCGTTSTG